MQKTIDDLGILMLMPLQVKSIEITIRPQNYETF